MNHLNLGVNASETIALKGLGSSGYRWSFTIDNPQVARVERIAADPAKAGSRDEQFRVTGVAAGKTVVHFSQTRSFEPNKPPRATYEVEVQVSRF